MLLGDIGSGKSTLVCEFVERSLSESPTSLSFIVPASSLSVSPNLMLKALLGQVSAYFSEQIAPTSYAPDVQSVLGQGTEVTLAIDGLDEMGVSSASLQGSNRSFPKDAKGLMPQPPCYGSGNLFQATS